MRGYEICETLQQHADQIRQNQRRLIGDPTLLCVKRGHSKQFLTLCWERGTFPSGLPAADRTSAAGEYITERGGGALSISTVNPWENTAAAV